MSIKFWTHTRIDELAKMIRLGKTDEEAALYFGRTPMAIKVVRKASGIKLPGTPPSQGIRVLEAKE